ncbi:MAG: hypothetical protein M3Y04_07730 [Actinomycetota bacterium]|nr:hypothetical protein [Actinomycetota bacterium]
MTDTDSLEQALAEIERDADSAVRGLTAALKEAKKVKAAAAAGQLKELRQGLDSAVRMAAAAAATAKDVRDGWTFDEQGYFAGGGYTKEVLALATEEGVQAFESDDRILCYPAIVQVAADNTVVIDKKKDRRTRPSVLVATLKALQSRPPKFKAETFLAALVTGYDLVRARHGARPGATVKLADVYSVLTVLPGSARDYTKQEFARDLYLLDQSGITRANDGRTLQLPASALTRGSAAGLFTTVTRSGQAKMYAGISLDGGTA